MQTSVIYCLSRHACWVAAVAAILWPALDAVAQDKKKVIIRQHPADAPRVRTLEIGDDGTVVHIVRQKADDRADAPPAGTPDREAGPSRWWLGLECVPVERTLGRHLGLKEGQGLIVMHVVEGSAADKAGLKPDDVLLRADNRELGSLKDLIDAVNASEGEKLKLELIRDGKETTVEVTPLERPRDPRMGPFLRATPGTPLRFRVLGPGAIEPFNVKIYRERPKLPKDVTVTITATGEEPIRVKVQRGEDTWDLAADEIDQLPEDLRPAVAALLPTRDVFRPAGRMHMTGPGAPYPGMPEMLPGWQAFEFPGHEDLQKQIDDLRKRMEELQKQFSQ